jgi:hypothetical protein
MKVETCASVLYYASVPYGLWHGERLANATMELWDQMQKRSVDTDNFSIAVSIVVPGSEIIGEYFHSV